MWHTGNWQRVLLINEQGTSLLKQSTMEQENITRQFYNGGDGGYTYSNETQTETIIVLLCDRYPKLPEKTDLHNMCNNI